MELQVVTPAFEMLRLAERSQTAERGETISLLKQAYRLLHPVEDGAADRILDTLIDALALNEAAMLLIPPLCAERVDWHRYKGDPLTHIVHEVHIEMLEDSKLIGYGESLHRPLAYIGAAMRAHAYLRDGENSDG